MAKAARSVGRLDWWNLFAGMTPYEIAHTQALWGLEPWGDDRADLRAAINTVAAAGVPGEKIGEAVAELSSYLPIMQDDATREVTGDEAVALFGV